MARYAIGDVQGCYDQLRELVKRVGFSSDRDRLWFVGDLVNRGPKSLQVLRYVRALGDNAAVVLGNHDLHLLALAYGRKDKRKPGDTLDEILAASDRDELLEWLASRPLAHFENGDLMVHAGVIPQWSATDAVAISREVEEALVKDAQGFFDEMYGNEPRCWSEKLRGPERIRFAVNVLARMRVCTAQGCLDLAMKGKPQEAKAPFKAWFEHENRRSTDARLIFGHWSVLGYLNKGNVIGLDTGCVWGGKLTAVDLESSQAPIDVTCGPS